MRDAAGLPILDSRDRRDDPFLSDDDGLPSGGKKTFKFNFPGVQRKPGFFVRVYIDADAQNPEHILDPPLLCPPTMTVDVGHFPAGTNPGAPAEETERMTKQTYRLRISSTTSGIAEPFTVTVGWHN